MTSLKIRLAYRRHELDRLREKLTIGVAWHLVPRKLAYWCAIRVMVEATTGRWSDQVVPELYAVDALKRWNMP